MARVISDSIQGKKPPGGPAAYGILGITCAIVILVLGWIAESALLPVRPQAEDTYYNLLVRGFRAGQLSLITPPPAGLTQLTNPYDSRANAP